MYGVSIRRSTVSYWSQGCDSHNDITLSLCVFWCTNKQVSLTIAVDVIKMMRLCVLLRTWCHLYSECCLDHLSYTDADFLIDLRTRQTQCWYFSMVVTSLGTVWCPHGAVKLWVQRSGCGVVRRCRFYSSDTLNVEAADLTEMLVFTKLSGVTSQKTLTLAMHIGRKCFSNSSYFSVRKLSFRRSLGRTFTMYLGTVCDWLTLFWVWNVLWTRSSCQTNGNP